MNIPHIIKPKVALKNKRSLKRVLKKQKINRLDDKLENRNL